LLHLVMALDHPQGAGDGAMHDASASGDRQIPRLMQAAYILPSVREGEIAIFARAKIRRRNLIIRDFAG
jgi:hypothetical protein